MMIASREDTAKCVMDFGKGQKVVLEYRGKPIEQLPLKEQLYVRELLKMFKRGGVR